MGRHKIEIKKIDEKHSRQICFTKRRKGLFKKANDLARRGFHVAVVVRSAADNTYVYGSPNADSVAERFVCDLPATPVPNQKQVASTSRSMHADGGDDDDDKEMFFDCDNNDRMVELLKSDRFWWNKSIENLGVEELIEFTEKLKVFASMVKERAKLLWIEKPLSLSLSLSAWR